jgi:adenine-specific DNA-methyltransferase
MIAQRLGTIAASLDPLDAAYVIGRTYAASLPADMRTDLGVYYTPPEVAERLLNQAERAGIDWRHATVLDPACGGGAFLAPVARRMAAAMERADPDGIIGSIERRLRGYEVDAFSGWMSQVFVDAVLLDISSAAGRGTKLVVSVRDTLDTAPRAPGFDLVIGNPPYGRTRLTPERRERYARSLYGHANLYGLFTDYALQCANPHGTICFVTPTSFLGGEYFKSLRSVLAKDAPPETIDFLADRDGVFDDVLQETLLVTYRKGGAQTRVRVALVQPSDTGLGIHDIGPFRLPTSPESPWVLPRSRGEARVAKRLGELRYRLRDWGYAVSTGPLVWNRHKGQLRDSPGPRCVPLIWAEAVRPDGAFQFRADKKNHSPYFRVLPGDGSLLVDEPCILVQRTTAKEQHRRLIAAELPASFLAQHVHVTVENHLNMVKPLCGSNLLEGTRQGPAVAPRTVAAFLNTEVADRAFRCLSGSVAVSAFELESLPLPDPDLLGPVAQAVSDRAPLAEIDRLCSKLYGF